MSIVLFTSDLMFQSRVASVAKSLGHSLVVVRSADSLADRIATSDPPPFVVFDLGLRSLDVQSAVAHVRQHYPDAKLIAFGPHVDVEALEKARDAGIDQVMTRGQFDREMATVLGG